MSKFEDILLSIQDYLNGENETVGKGELEFNDQGEQCEVCAEDGLEVCQGHLYLPSSDTYL